MSGTGTRSAPHRVTSGGGGLLRQPKSVWAVAFACVVSFMGIGLVDPILPLLRVQLHATPSQISLLFTSYFLVTAVAMLVTGWLSTRIGAKKTILAGLTLIVVFSALAGLSSGVTGIVWFRGGWGIGNALFIATSLATIVGAASGGFGAAIMLYEAALGLGIALGPLVGGVLGGVSWRGPFFGVTVLMAVGLILVVTLLGPTPRPPVRSSVADPIRALRHRGLLTVAITALLYNWAFFTILGYAPYPMRASVHVLGYIFTAWGVLVAIFAVFFAPLLQRLAGTAVALYLSLFLMALDVAALGIWASHRAVLIACVIITGAFIGLNNTLVTSTAMSVAPVPRPVASAAYSFVRFLGAGLAPYVASTLVTHFGIHAPFYLAAGAVFLAVPVLATAHRLVGAAGAGTEAGEEAVEEMIEATEGDVVHGHIRRAGGAPVAGAALTLIDHDGHQIARGTSGPDGYYTIIGRRSGAHVLIVSAAGYRPEACPVVLTGGAVEVPVVLTGGVALRGTVAVADGGPPGTGGRPAAGAAVTLVDPGGQVIERQRTGQDGRYLFHAVPSGAYTLAVSMARCQPAVRAITVPAAGTVTADVTLAPHGPVDGLIRARQDGRPLRDALVTLLDASGTIVATTVTGADGRYRVPGVPEGDYTLIASGYPPVRATLRLTAGAQVTCDLTLGYAAGRAGGSDSSQPGGAPPERNGHHGGEGAGWDGHEGRDGHGGTGA